MSYVYTNRLRASLSLLPPNSSSWVQAYGYDAAKRFSSVTSLAGTFNYRYPAGMQDGLKEESPEYRVDPAPAD